jgi:hypothetical protein
LTGAEVTTQTAELRYLFGVHYADGREYFQAADDHSELNPEKSSYYDVLQAQESGQQIHLFQLEGQGHKYLVDLRDGHFEIDGAPFYVQIPPPDAQLSLDYFRRRRHHANATYRMEDGAMRLVDLQDSGQECEYHFGWKAGDQKVMLVLI